MRRFIISDNLGNALGELAPNNVFSVTRREEINGEHSLEIVTTQALDKGNRVLYKDGRELWREYVVTGIEQTHEIGDETAKTYYCTWSVQHDLLGVTVSRMPGTQTPVSAHEALAAALSNQQRWTVGTVSNSSTGGASMYDMSAWAALGVLIDVWGGEIDVTVEVDNLGAVVSRKVDLYAQIGEQTATRRFDFGADVVSIKRKFGDSPLYCRISPRGKGEETEGGGYGRKITIESVNGGRDYLEYAPMVDVCKMTNGSGGYVYPTLIVENSEITTPAELLAWGEIVLEEYCTPEITYEVDVFQAGEEGVDFTGVSLGDVVHVVDKKFGGDGLRLSARIVSMETDELNGHSVTVELGYIDSGLAGKFGLDNPAIKAIDTRLNALVTDMSTSDYVTSLLERINAEVNATGGYTYIVEGEGIKTYDHAVSDPSIGSEASQVVEIKGGSIRIANSRTSGGAWDWKSVFTSGRIAAEMIVAAAITTGFIGSYNLGTYWDLDTGRLVTTKATIGGFTISSNAIYNDKVKLDSAGLSIRYNGVDMGSVWASNYQVGTTDIGLMQIAAPGVLQITSKYLSSDNRVTVAQYSRSADKLSIYRNTQISADLNVDSAGTATFYNRPAISSGVWDGEFSIGAYTWRVVDGLIVSRT